MPRGGAGGWLGGVKTLVGNVLRRFRVVVVVLVVVMCCTVVLTQTGECTLCEGVDGIELTIGQACKSSTERVNR